MMKRLTALLLAMMMLTALPAALAENTVYIACPNAPIVILMCTPDEDSMKRGLFRSGTPAVIDEARSDEEWAYVTIGEVQGFLQRAYLSDTQPQSAAETWYVSNPHSTWVHLRQGPSTDTPSLGRYDNGTPVLHMGEVDGWCYLQVDGKTGYMYYSMLESSEPANVPAPTVVPGGFIPITTSTPEPTAYVDWSAWDFGNDEPRVTPAFTPAPTPTPFPTYTTILGMTSAGDYIHLYATANNQYICFDATEETPYFFEEDVNFDGMNDIVVCTIRGASNAFYEFFVFDGTRYHHAAYPGEGIPNYVLYPDEQLVSSHVNNGWAASLHEICLYRWDGYKLKTIRRATGEEYTETQFESDRTITTTWNDRVRFRVWHDSEDTDEGTVVFEEIVKLDDLDYDVFLREEAALWEGLR
ncbi:MAG: SH3 domain-containing protein [Clostridia bacterium]|nr:SH3 domain-containing protein [Clostridia bacterium]